MEIFHTFFYSLPPHKRQTLIGRTNPNFSFLWVIGTCQPSCTSRHGSYLWTACTVPGAASPVRRLLIRILHNCARSTYLSANLVQQVCGGSVVTLDICFTSNTTGHYLVLRIRCMILLRSNNFHGLIKKDEASLINPAITVKLFMGASVFTFV